MVTIRDRWFVLRGRRQDLPARIDVDALTLGDAIREAERIFGIPIKPATAHHKYFVVGEERDADVSDPPVPSSWLQRALASWIRPRPVPGCPPGFGNTDIHIRRNGATLCPKHDLEFPLVAGDVIVFDALLC